MPLKTFKPITPSARYKNLPSFDEITKSKPEKSLLTPLKRSGGRNNTGRITCRHIGGGHKRHYRLIDFKRGKLDMPAKVMGIEYDPVGDIRASGASTSTSLPRYGTWVGALESSRKVAEVEPLVAMLLSQLEPITGSVVQA